MGHLGQFAYVMEIWYICERFGKLGRFTKTVAYKVVLENICCCLREGGPTGYSIFSSLITAPGPL